MNRNLDLKYWFNIVDNIAQASTCRIKIGTILILNREIVGVGFLGSTPGDLHCCDSGCLYVETNVIGSGVDGKSCIRTIHSEMNAVLRCTARGSETEWIQCYTTYKPCLNCLKSLLSIGVRVIYYKNDYRDLWRDKYLENLDIELYRSIYMSQVNV